MSDFTPKLLRFDSLPSTNSEVARRAIAGAEEGLFVVAREQTAGRGRLQRQWNSPKDAGLYLSVLLRPQFAPRSWPLISLMSAVATHDALFSACSLTTDIKWPNDLLADQKKLCGILAETVETPVGRAVVVGIGINLTSDAFPDELQAQATSVKQATDRTVDLEKLLADMIESIKTQYECLGAEDGAQRVIREWCARSSYAEGKSVNVLENDEMLTGTTRGLESDGALRVETYAGEIRTVRAGDVTSVRSA